jgi:CDP-diacylglycerol---glycerol-3-phosphate 3-phosphatidyltransferase
VSAGIAYFLGHPRWAGLLVLIGGIFDILDGQVARGTGLASAFGSFYDSTLDRISEIVVFLGIFSLYGGGHPDFPHPWMVYVVALALAGSLMVSYTRARAESLGLDCKVGLMQRPERVVLIGVSSLLFGGAFEGWVLTGVLLIMAATTNFTTFQRIVWVYRHTQPLRPADARVGSRASFDITPKSQVK